MGAGYNGLGEAGLTCTGGPVFCEEMGKLSKFFSYKIKKTGYCILQLFVMFSLKLVFK